MRRRILTLALMLGLLLLPHSLASASDDEALLAYLPGDALGIMVMDFRAMNDTPALKRVRGAMEGSDAMDNAMSAITEGTSLREEQVHRIAVAILSTSTSSPRALSVISGDFSADDMREALAADTEGAETMERVEEDLYSHDQGALYIIGDGLVALGTTDEVRAVRERTSEGTGHLHQRLRTQLAHVNRSLPMWFAARANDEMHALDPRLEGIHAFSGELDISGDFHFSMHFATSGEEATNALLQDFEKQQAELRQGSSADILRSLQVLPLLDGLTMEEADGGAKLQLRIPEVQWMALVETMATVVESEFQ